MFICIHIYIDIFSLMYAYINMSRKSASYLCLGDRTRRL